MEESSGLRLDSFAVSPDRRIAQMNRVIREGVRDVHVLVVGDSTGAGAVNPIRWVRRLATKIAMQWPTHTVLYKGFDNTANTYSVENQTVQTGSGPRAIHVWNASVSGSAIGNAIAKIGNMVNGFRPDIVFWNFGHNSPQNGDDYRSVAMGAMQEYALRFPDAAVVVVGQNATTAPFAGPETSQDKVRATLDLAQMEGWTIADTYRAYVETPNWQTELLLPDGLHPSSAGSEKQAEVIWEAIRPGSSSPLVITGPGRQSKPTRVIVPAAAFYPVSGSSQIGRVGDHQAWELPDGVDTFIAATMIDAPSDWRFLNIYAIWTTAVAPGAARDVRWDFSRMYMGGVNAWGQASGSDISTWLNDGATTGSSSGSALRVASTVLWNRSGLGSRPLAFKIGRTGAHAADTLAASAWFLGLVIDRAY